MYPAWSFWEGGPAISLYPTGIGRWDKHRISISGAAEKLVKITTTINFYIKSKTTPVQLLKSCSNIS